MGEKVPGLVQVWLLEATVRHQHQQQVLAPPVLSSCSWAHTGHWFWLPALILCCNAEPCGCHCLLPCVCRPRNVALRPQLGYCSWLPVLCRNKGR